MAGRGSKPGERRGDRVKGAKNKITVSVKEALIGALNAGDGAEAFFLKVKESDPKTFCTIVGRLLPREVTGPEGRDLHLPGEWSFGHKLDLARRYLFLLAQVDKEAKLKE